jgi:hypothetical protein
MPAADRHPPRALRLATGGAITMSRSTILPAKPFRLLCLGAAGIVAGVLFPMSAAGWVGVGGGIVENRGQIEGPVRYYANADQASLYFTAGSVVLDLSEEGYSIWMRFEGASPTAALEGRGERETRHHFFLGNDPARWVSDVRVYDELVYRDLWPGIDMSFRVEAGQLRYAIIAAPGADEGQARWRFEGAESRVEGEDGCVRLEIPSREVWDCPVLAEGTGRTLRWGRTGDAAEGGTREEPGTIAWGTFLGSSNQERAHGLTQDLAGNPIIGGYTNSANFPTTPGAYDRTLAAGSYDVVVAKLDRTGSRLLWSTLMGGDLEDRPFGIVIDSHGNPTFAGLA